MSTAVLQAPPPKRTESRHAKRLLLVSYCFPPVGGAGVQRPVKWVKYLYRAGWKVTVLTPENPSVPVIDESLLREVPAETAFLRPRTWEPDYATKNQLVGATSGQVPWWSYPSVWMRGVARAAVKVALQPDPQILWYRNAVRAAAEHLQQTPHDAILATAPPYSSFLIGTALRRRFGIPLILDYRDEWDLSNLYLENAPRDQFSWFVQEQMQRWVLKHADAVLATTNASTRNLQSRLHEVRHPAHTACIYNGYDAEDFNSQFLSRVVPPPAPGKFRIVYTGTLWNLTSIEPLVSALERLQKLAPELAAKIELVCVGRKTPEQQAVLDRLNATSCRLISIGYCDHGLVIDWMRSAHAVCLLLTDVPGSERVVPSKLFEYLASRKDLLAIVPKGECAQIVGRFHPEGKVTPDDVTGIVNWLQSRLRTQNHSSMLTNAGDIEDYRRDRQTTRLVNLLEELTASAKPSRSNAAGG